MSRTRHSSVWVNVNERRLLDVVELERVDDIGNAKFLEDYYYLELLFSFNHSTSLTIAVNLTFHGFGPGASGQLTVTPVGSTTYREGCACVGVVV